LKAVAAELRTRGSTPQQSIDHLHREAEHGGEERRS
jgi:hypothetical protein